MAKEIPKKRILLLSYLDYWFPSGLSRRIKGISEELIKAGYQVEVLAPNFRLPYIRSPDGKVKVMRVDLRFLRFIGCETLLAKILANILFSLFGTVYIGMKRRRIFIVQYESIFSFPAGMLAKLVTRCPLIGDDVLPIAGSLLLSRLHVLAGLLSDTITVSAAESKSKFPFYQRGKIVTLSTGARTTPKDPGQLKAFPLTAVFVGSPSYMPNRIAANHIRAAAQRLPKDLRLELLIIGGFLKNGSQQEGCLRYRRKLSDSELRSVFSRSHIGLLPFFGTVTEGPKVKALEFFSSGLLVISSVEGVQGIRDLIPWVHYVPADSIEELRNRLIECTDNAKAYRRIAESGKKHVLENYSWERITRGYVNLIRRLEKETLTGNK